MLETALILQFNKGGPDGLHLQEMRDIGIIMMAIALTHYLTRESNDKATEINLLWSRTVVIVCLLWSNIEYWLLYKYCIVENY